MVHSLNYHATIRLQPDTAAAQLRRLESLKKIVPGFRFWSNGLTVGAYCADHAVDLVHAQLGKQGFSFTWTGAPGLPPEEDPTDVGYWTWAQAHHRGEVRKPEPELHPYQLEAAGLGASNPRMVFWHATGSGKTRTGFVAAVSAPGPILWLSTVGALSTQRTGIKEISDLEVHIWMPPSRRRKKYEDTDAYMKRMRLKKQRPVVLVGYENIVQAQDDLNKYSFPIVVGDEIHKAKSHSRWEAIPETDGAMSFEMKQNITAVTASFFWKAGRRYALTATMVPNTTSDVHGIITLVDPKAWGNFYDFGFRYCAAVTGFGGSVNTKGASHLDELNDRLAFVVHYVTKEQVREFMPPVRRQTYYLGPDDLNGLESGWKSELKASIRMGGAEAVADAQAALTAGRKHRWLVKQIKDLLREGRKVLVFGGFRKDVERLYDALEKACSGDKHIPSDTVLTWTHGEHQAGPGGEREGRIKSYMDAPGAACLIGTIETIGESLNLQMTDYLIFAKLPVTPLKLIQGEGRGERLGRKLDASGTISEVVIWYVVAQGTGDERLAELLIEKLPAVGTLSKDGTLATVVEVLKGADRYDTLLADLVSDLGDEVSEWTIPED